MPHSPMLAPMMTLVLWTLVMCGWTYATRIPAISRNKVVYDPARPAAEFHAQLPAPVRWKADNLNNLMEQPTLFYAVAVAFAALGAGSGFDLVLAWLYVGLRVAHSLVQATVNKVAVRFPLFMAATLALLVMAVRVTLILL